MSNIKCDAHRMDLRTALDLSIQQYEIMFAADSFTEESTKLGAIRKMMYRGYLQKEAAPAHDCFICQYVRDNFTDPGYSYFNSPGEEDCVLDNEDTLRFSCIAWCALYCPMVGILWDYRGCHMGDNPFNNMVVSKPKDRKKYIAEILVGFRKLKERCEAVENTQNQGNA